MRFYYKIKYKIKTITLCFISYLEVKDEKGTNYNTLLVLLVCGF